MKSCPDFQVRTACHPQDPSSSSRGITWENLPEASNLSLEHEDECLPEEELEEKSKFPGEESASTSKSCITTENGATRPAPRSSAPQSAVWTLPRPTMSSSTICSTKRCRTLSQREDLKNLHSDANRRPTPRHPNGGGNSQATELQAPCVGKVGCIFCTGWKTGRELGRSPVGGDTERSSPPVNTTVDHHRT